MISSISPRILYCASTLSHLKNFHLPYIDWLCRQGCLVYALMPDSFLLTGMAGTFSIPFSKKLMSFHNVHSIFVVYKLLKKEQFDLIVTNTTPTGLVVRAAALLLNKALRPTICHICHGYPFRYKLGIRKLIYLIPEMICARVTDHLIIMNHEDEQSARRYHLFLQDLTLVQGMGLPDMWTNLISATQTAQNRALLGISPMTFVLLYAAEFTKRKNHAQLLLAFAKAYPQMPDTILILAGDGVQKIRCERLAYRLHISQQVRFLGHVHDMHSLLHCCDAVVSPSLGEGIPFNILEAMACGLPILASDVKGNKDLLQHSHAVLFKTQEELVTQLIALRSRGAVRVVYPQLHRYLLTEVQNNLTELFSKWLTLKSDDGVIVKKGVLV